MEPEADSRLPGYRKHVLSWSDGAMHGKQLGKEVHAIELLILRLSAMESFP